MVADRVTVVTRKVGEETATKWESTGEGSYTLEEASRDGHGTSVTLHLKEEDAEDELHDYTAEWTIRGIIKKYSDFVTYPIRMNVERTEPVLDDDGKPVEGAEPKVTYEDETLNSMKAIWARSSSEVTDDEYKEFYKHVSHDWNDPLLRISLRAEGTIEFAALLYIPSTAPVDMFYREFKKGVQLYVKRVFIMDDCEELVPNYLRFIKGVVDSEDLSLNISREILQQNRQIRVMRKRVVRKVLDTLTELKKDKPEEFVKFWNEFGKVLKEGLFEDVANQEKLFEVCMFETTNSEDEDTTLGDYVDRMKTDQETIYYMTGETRLVIENSPHLEAFTEKGIEVLILPDPVDEIWLQTTPEFEGKKFESISKGAAELGTEEERKTAEEELKTKEDEVKELLEALQKHLDEDIKEVRLSSRLTKSPVCLVGDSQDMSPQLEALMKQVGQDMPVNKRILEINPKHALLEKLAAVHKANADDARLGDFAQLLHGQALLAEGTAVKDPAKLAGLIADLMVQSI